MKKISLLLASLLTIGALTACGDEKKDDDDKKKYPIKVDIVGGTADEQEALLKGINTIVCQISGKNATPTGTQKLSEDNGDIVKVTTAQKANVNSKSYTVNIEWACDESSQYFSQWLDSDAQHKLIEIKYQGYGKEVGDFSWWMKKITCGGAVADNANVKYNAKVYGEQYKHEDKTIEFINAVTETPKTVTLKDGTKYYYPSTFDLVDYDIEYDEDGKEKKYSPYFKTNNPDAEEAQYFYVNVACRVVYLAPDGNWGLVHDGSNYLEIYAGAGTKLTPVNWPNLNKEYVVISGNVSQYCGNIQLGFITQIKEATPEQKAAINSVAGDYIKVDETFIEDHFIDEKLETAQVQAIKGVSNSMATVTGTLVAGSIKQGEKEVAASALQDARFTFELKVGEQKQLIAYDYHTNDGTFFNTLKSALAKGGEMTIDGTLRYAGNDTNPFILQGNPGVWSIVPFLSSHVK